MTVKLSRIHDRRGNNRDRAARKKWMLATWGNGVIAYCVHCRNLVDYDSVQADRIEPGGTYARRNVQPACGPCNTARGGDPNWRYTG